MIKAVIFDLWGTLVENGTYSPLKQTYALLRINMPFGPFVHRFEELFMTKTFSSQEEGFKEVCTDFQVQQRKEIIDQLIGVWNKNKLLATLYPDTEETLRLLKNKGVKIGLLSNTPMDSGRFIIKKFDLEKYFDVVHLSCETGLVKQHPQSFQAMLIALGIKENEALMIGDSFETDINGAEEAGIKAILIDRKDRREFDPKIKMLKEVERFL